MNDHQNVIDLTSEESNLPPTITPTPIYHPFYLLTTTHSSEESYEITLQDILSGEIKSILLMNYMYDFPWLISHCPILSDPLIEVCCLHGTKGAQNQYKQDLNNLKLHHWVLSEVEMGQERWGTHHTKMIIAIYESGIRICVSSANFLECDFQHLTQGVYVQDFPLQSTVKKSQDPVPAEMMNENFGYTEFYQPLVEYLRKVVPVTREATFRIKQFIPLLDRYDFTSSRVALVPSVPGKHQFRAGNWGRLRMEYLLRKYNRSTQQQSTSTAVEPPRKALVIQVSSIGSLGPGERYLSELKCSLLADQPFSLSNSTSIELVWPTVQCVSKSFLGYHSGGSMPLYSQIIEENNRIKFGFTNILRKWVGVLPGRARFPPHMKCYFSYNLPITSTPSLDENQENSSETSRKKCRREENENEKNEEDVDLRLNWFLLTSANLSQAAWGVSQKNNQQLYIKSYEMGVLFLPAILSNYPLRSFSCTPSHNKLGLQVMLTTTTPSECQFYPFNPLSSTSSPSSSASEGLQFPIPFQIPPPRYQLDDLPWIVDKSYLELDSRGNCWIPR